MAKYHLHMINTGNSLYPARWLKNPKITYNTRGSQDTCFLVPVIKILVECIAENMLNNQLICRIVWIYICLNLKLIILQIETLAETCMTEKHYYHQLVIKPTGNLQQSQLHICCPCFWQSWCILLLPTLVPNCKKRKRNKEFDQSCLQKFPNVQTFTVSHP